MAVYTASMCALASSVVYAQALALALSLALFSVCADGLFNGLSNMYVYDMINVCALLDT